MQEPSHCTCHFPSFVFPISSANLHVAGPVTPRPRSHMSCSCRHFRRWLSAWMSCFHLPALPCWLLPIPLGNQHVPHHPGALTLSRTLSEPSLGVASAGTGVSPAPLALQLVPGEQVSPLCYLGPRFILAVLLGGVPFCVLWSSRPCSRRLSPEGTPAGGLRAASCTLGLTPPP